MFQSIVLIVVLIAAVSVSSFKIERKHKKSTDCKININGDLPESAALLVETGSTNILYPDNENGILQLSNGETFEAICVGNNFQTFDDESIIVTCKSGSLTVDNSKISFVDLNCTKHPFHTARYTNKKCAKDYKEVEIGFLINDGRFVRQIDSCFDDVNERTLYSHHSIPKYLKSQAHEVPRPFFIEDGFYKEDINKLYNRKTQRNTINGLVGLSATSQKYVQDTTYLYLSRGHFAPKAAFVYPIQQSATFHYVNTAPQWQTFNGGNWNEIEMSVRKYVEDNHVDVEIYTGSYGIASLPHSQTGKEVPLYFYVSGKNKSIPVPKLYWKVVYDLKSKSGVALVGVNNPFLKKIGDNLICKDISSQLSWLSWNPDNAEDGFSYACDVDDLRKVVPHVPELDIESILE